MSTKIKLTLSLLLIAFVLLFIAGCQTSQLRFAPTEPQKQIAFQGYLNAQRIATDGTFGGSPAALQNLQASQVAFNYIGPPANPVITDYSTTYAQAAADANSRPTVTDISQAVDEGLSLATELAILFGVGGCGFGGKKLLDWIKLAKQKNKALKEIIDNNELFQKTAEPKAIKQFKNAQTKQSKETKVLVTEIKS